MVHAQIAQESVWGEVEEVGAVSAAKVVSMKAMAATALPCEIAGLLTHRRQKGFEVPDLRLRRS